MLVAVHFAPDCQRFDVDWIARRGFGIWITVDSDMDVGALFSDSFELSVSTCHENCEGEMPVITPLDQNIAAATKAVEYVKARMPRSTNYIHSPNRVFVTPQVNPLASTEEQTEQAYGQLQREPERFVHLQTDASAFARMRMEVNAKFERSRHGKPDDAEVTEKEGRLRIRDQKRAAAKLGLETVEKTLVRRLTSS